MLRYRLPCETVRARGLEGAKDVLHLLTQYPPSINNLPSERNDGANGPVIMYRELSAQDPTSGSIPKQGDRHVKDVKNEEGGKTTSK
jgi:hypothetical protein